RRPGTAAAAAARPGPRPPPAAAGPAAVRLPPPRARPGLRRSRAGTCPGTGAARVPRSPSRRHPWPRPGAGRGRPARPAGWPCHGRTPAARCPRRERRRRRGRCAGRLGRLRHHGLGRTCAWLSGVGPGWGNASLAARPGPDLARRPARDGAFHGGRALAVRGWRPYPRHGGPMDIGMVGLGRMGGNMALRLARGGHRVVGFDHAGARGEVAELETVQSLPELVAALPVPRVVWLMVPAGAPVDLTLDQLLPLLQPGDVVVDGGNSNYHDSERRAARCSDAGVHFLDCGTSGGVWGLQEGYSLMIGGEAGAVALLRPVFETLAPAPDRGWGHVGPSGAGHFTKMVHNGIEYGMMQAY